MSRTTAAATATYRVSFGNGSSGYQEGGRIPRVAGLLALAHKIDAKIRSGELKNLADAARAVGVTRARMTQMMNLLLLAPEIQEAILDLPPVTNGRGPVAERQLRAIATEPDWQKQLAAWRRIHE